MFVDLISKEPSSAVIVVTLLTGGLLALVAIVTSTLKSYAVDRMEFALKRDMVARGMSAEAIAQVINTHSTPPEESDAVPLSWPSAVLVQADGEWREALVLQAARGRYYVHFVGTEMDENTWVEQECVRFPAGSELPTLVARARETPANGVPTKESVEEEV